MDHVTAFEAHRGLLLAIAYRMTGSFGDAEDLAQEAYLRFKDVPAESVRAPKALLTTIITRLCLNHLDLSRTRREQYVGEWLPEPLPGAEDAAALNPSQALVLHESVSMAFMVVLETLTPLERAAFLLREVFDYAYAEIAAIIEREEAACRQAVSRAKKHLRENRPRLAEPPDNHKVMLERFLSAVGGGDLGALVTMLTGDATLYADGGGKARGAATRPIVGAAAVAHFVMASTRLLPGTPSVEIVILNGEPAAVIRADSVAALALFISVENGKIATIRVIGNPDKLRHL